MLEEARLEEARTGVGVATVLVEEARPASARASVVTLVNSSIGAGILVTCYAAPAPLHPPCPAPMCPESLWLRSNGCHLPLAFPCRRSPGPSG